jgi:hypothetical protein
VVLVSLPHAPNKTEAPRFQDSSGSPRTAKRRRHQVWRDDARNQPRGVALNGGATKAIMEQSPQRSPRNGQGQEASGSGGSSVMPLSGSRARYSVNPGSVRETELAVMVYSLRLEDAPSTPSGEDLRRRPYRQTRLHSGTLRRHWVASKRRRRDALSGCEQPWAVVG